METTVSSTRVPWVPVKCGDVLDGKYHVERVLGQGGMGMVVEARHDVLEQQFAIKVLSGDAMGSAEATTRFIQEARLAAKIASPHAARVFDVGTLENGSPFIVMEHLTGLDLAHLLEQRGPLPLGEATDYVLQACDAIAEAHSHGIVHRDLKPQNLFVARQRDGSSIVKVLDFGIAKSLVAEREVTMAGRFLGTPHYMAPEQIRSAIDVDNRTDVWSIGVVLYRLLTNRFPFEGSSITVLASHILDDPPVALAMHRPDLPPELDPIVWRCLAKDRADRYANIADLADALLPFSTSSRSSIGRIRRLVDQSGSVPTTTTTSVEDGGSRRDTPRSGVPSGATSLRIGLAATVDDSSRSLLHAQPVSIHVSTSEPRSRRGWIVVVAGLLVTALGTLLVAAWQHREKMHAVADLPPAPASALVGSPPPVAAKALPPPASASVPAPPAPAVASSSANRPLSSSRHLPGTVTSKTSRPPPTAKPPSTASPPATASAGPDFSERF